MADHRPCPRCGAVLAEDSPNGLCPKCLVQAAFESGATGGRPGPAATAANPVHAFVPPAIEEMAARFPQLEILDLLGKGGMGAVYKARQPGLDRLVAIKILPPHVGADPAFAERFQREARALAKLNHPNIVGVYDFGKSDGLYYFLMEYVHGANLRQTMRLGQLEPPQALAIVPQICDALQYAHDEGVVHRDIKPENILLDTKGRVKIADFGLSKLMGEERADEGLTGTHEVMGTLRYMAPEQVQGTKTVDHRADIFSLGVVFYELLTGSVPMGRFDPPSRKVQIDVRLDEVVLRALEEEPAKRYQRAGDVKTDVESVRTSPRVARREEPAVTSASAASGAGEDFTIQGLPRSGFDLLLFFGIMLPWIAGMFTVIPAIIVLALAFSFGMAPDQAFPLAVMSGLVVMTLFCIVLSIGSVYALRVDGEGIMVHPLLGPSKFLPWGEVRRIEPLTWWETVRQVWLWPGLPARGSILSMTATHFFRIDCRGDCWYFAPPQVEPFFAAIAKAQARVLPEGKPAADDPLYEARNIAALPAVCVGTLAGIYVFSGGLLLLMGLVLPGFWAVPVPVAGSFGLASLFALVFGLVLFEGTRRMVDLANYAVVLTIMIVMLLPAALLTWFVPGFWIPYVQIALGLWAIFALLRPEVQAGFAGLILPPPASSSLLAAGPDLSDPSERICATGALVSFSLALIGAPVLGMLSQNDFFAFSLLIGLLLLALVLGVLGFRYAIGRWTVVGVMAIGLLAVAICVTYFLSAGSPAPAAVAQVAPPPAPLGVGGPTNPALLGNPEETRRRLLLGKWTESNDTNLEPVHRLELLESGEWHESGPLSISLEGGPATTLAEDLDKDGKQEILRFYATGWWRIKGEELTLETIKTNLVDSKFHTRQFTIVELTSERLVLKLRDEKNPMQLTMFREP